MGALEHGDHTHEFADLSSEDLVTIAEGIITHKLDGLVLLVFNDQDTTRPTLISHHVNKLEAIGHLESIKQSLVGDTMESVNITETKD